MTQWIYLWNRNRLTDLENRPVVAKGRGEGTGAWDSRHKLEYTGQINHKVLLYSLGSYILYPVINQDGKE